MVTVDVEKKQVTANGHTFTFGAIPQNLLQIVENGGLIADTKQRVAAGLMPSACHKLDDAARRKKGFTRAEKLLRCNAGGDAIQPGDIVITHPDMFMIHDIYTPYLLDTLQKMGWKRWPIRIRSRLSLTIVCPPL